MTQPAAITPETSWASKLSWLALRPVFDALEEAVYVVDTERRILYWNGAAEQLTGFGAAEMVGSFCFDNLLQHVDDRDTPLCGGNCPQQHSLCTRTRHNSQLFLRHKEGHRVPVGTRIVPLVDGEGRVFAAAEIFHAVSPRSQNSRRLRETQRLAFEDALTGLPNRRYGEQELTNRLRALHSQDQPLAVLLLDLDGFKEINDTHGHAVGDTALAVVSRTLQSSLRTPDVVARWGGDEFVVLIAADSDGHVRSVAERLRILIRHSRVTLPRGTTSLTASIGATLAAAADTPLTVIARADRLMYVSKREGGDRVTYGDRAAESPQGERSPSNRPTLPSLRDPTQGA